MMTFNPYHQPTTIEIGVISAILSGIIFWYGWYFFSTMKRVNRVLQENNIRHDDLDD